MRDMVNTWRALPGCEHIEDGAWYSNLFEVRFWATDDGLLGRGQDLPAVVFDSGVQQWFENGVQWRSAGRPSFVAPMPTHIVFVGEVDGGLPETSGDTPYRRPRFTISDTPGARTEQMVEEWTDSQGRVSRADGPARKWADGTVAHYWEGKLHRDSGPAIEYPRPYGQFGAGPDEYWRHGRRHRIDGPAREPFRDRDLFRVRTGEYWLNGHHLPDVHSRWSVLRHYTEEGNRPRLDVDNVEAWDFLVASGAVNRTGESIEPTALAAALRLHPN